MADATKPGIGGPVWGRLTLAQLIALCDEYAREASQRAHAATPEVRPKYKANATQWSTLALNSSRSRWRAASPHWIGRFNEKKPFMTSTQLKCPAQ
jgi:hypothetical protein